MMAVRGLVDGNHYNYVVDNEPDFTKFIPSVAKKNHY